jgi:serine/threonine-protein kinase
MTLASGDTVAMPATSAPRSSSPSASRYRLVKRSTRTLGVSLSSLLADGNAMPRGVALRIAIDLCAALEEIHAGRGDIASPLALVHRDVCPQSVVVGGDGVARLEPRRSDASLGGTLGYMSPEVLGARTASASSDMFAFGVVVWEMLAGRRLFEADVASLDASARSAPRLSTVVGGIPSLLDVVVGKALASASIDRFASMQSVRVALEGAARGIIASREDVAAYVVASAATRTATSAVA